jgi:hypothetical protein
MQEDTLCEVNCSKHFLNLICSQFWFVSPSSNTEKTINLKHDHTDIGTLRPSTEIPRAKADGTNARLHATAGESGVRQAEET